MLTEILWKKVFTLLFYLPCGKIIFSSHIPVDKKPLRL